MYRLFSRPPLCEMRECELDEHFLKQLHFRTVFNAVPEETSDTSESTVFSTRNGFFLDLEVTLHDISCNDMKHFTEKRTSDVCDGVGERLLELDGDFFFFFLPVKCLWILLCSRFYYYSTFLVRLLYVTQFRFGTLFIVCNLGGGADLHWRHQKWSRITPDISPHCLFLAENHCWKR